MLGQLYRSAIEYFLNFIQKQWQHYEQSLEMKNSQRNRLRLVEHRLVRLTIMAKLNGLDDYELAKLVIPNLTNVIKCQDRSKGKKSTKHLMLIIILIIFLLSFALIGSLYYCRPCQRYGLKYSRLALFTMEPYWNWHKVYKTHCLLSRSSLFYANQYVPSTKESSKLYRIDCSYCEELMNISYVKDNLPMAHFDDIVTFQIANKIPLIIENNNRLKEEIKQWPLFTRFNNVQALNELYPLESWGRFCMFRSNVANVHDPISLINELNQSPWNESKWYAHWENCNLNRMKMIRQHYQRPTIIPPMIELSHFNWLLISNNVQKFNSFKRITPDDSVNLAVLIQVSGSIHLRLKAISPCHMECSSYQIQLKQFEMVVINVNHWVLEYKPMMMRKRWKDGEMNDISSSQAINLSLVLTGVHV